MTTSLRVIQDVSTYIRAGFTSLQKEKRRSRDGDGVLANWTFGSLCNDQSKGSRIGVAAAKGLDAGEIAERSFACSMAIIGPDRQPTAPSELLSGVR